ncbi:hypothetical protein JCM6882_006567 [Rhodosporidiobolus microsporus]
MGLDVERFQSELPGHLICPVCLDAATPPYTVCDADHVLCLGCAQMVHRTAVQKDSPPSCPTCRAAFAPKVSLFVKRALEEYKVVCDKKDEGCTWTGSVSDEQKHRDYECPYRPVLCQHCRALLTAKSVPVHLAHFCPMTEVQCPRGGVDCGGIAGNGRYLRRDSMAHDKRCGEYLCTLGCGTRTTLHRAKEHRTVCSALQQSRHQYYQSLRIATAENNYLRSQIASLNAASSAASTSGTSGTSSSPAPTVQQATTASPKQQQQEMQSPFFANAVRYGFSPFSSGHVIGQVSTPATGATETLTIEDTDDEEEDEAEEVETEREYEGELEADEDHGVPLPMVE